ncbi:MAG: rod shape-determining protein MreC [Calditrichia bacterium]
MKNIIRLFTQQNSLLLLSVYTLISILLISVNNPSTLRGVRIAVLRVIGWVNAVEQNFEFTDQLEKQNQDLRKELLELSITNQRLQEIMLQNIRLKKLLNFKEESAYNFLIANVVGLGQEKSVRSIIINVGLQDSVKKNYPVVTERGLVGKILIAEPRFSVVQILMDRNALVSARLQRSREIGVVSWSGNIWLDLDYVPKEVEIESGEAVVTSGLSHIYPPGLKIGVVGETSQNSYELFQKIKIKPAVNFNRLEEVFVILPGDSLHVDSTGKELTRDE